MPFNFDEARVDGWKKMVAMIEHLNKTLLANQRKRIALMKKWEATNTTGFVKYRSPRPHRDT